MVVTVVSDNRSLLSPNNTSMFSLTEYAAMIAVVSTLASASGTHDLNSLAPPCNWIEPERKFVKPTERPLPISDLMETVVRVSSYITSTSVAFVSPKPLASFALIL